MTQLKLAGLFTGLMSMLVFGVVGSASAASATLTADAEGASLIGFGVASNASVRNAAAYEGTYGYRVASTAAPGYLQWNSTDVEQGHEYASLAMLVRVNSQVSTESVDLVTIKNNQGDDHFDFFLTPQGEFKWDLEGATTWDTFPGAKVGVWYLVEARVFFGATTYSASVKINNIDQGTINSPSQTVGTVQSVWFGTSVAKTHSQDYDNMKVNVGETDQGWLGPDYADPTIATNCARIIARATVNPNGQPAHYRFLYGRTTDTTSSTAWASAGSGTTATVVEQTFTPTGMTTYYKAQVMSVGGIVTGPLRTETCS